MGRRHGCQSCKAHDVDGRGLANVDLIPSGPERRAVMNGTDGC